MSWAGYTKDSLREVVQKAGKGSWNDVENVMFNCVGSGNLEMIEHWAEEPCIDTSDDPQYHRQSTTKVRPVHC